jgi:hypothetical protein
MVTLFAFWSQTLDAAIDGVVHFFEQTSWYLQIDYTYPLRDVNPEFRRKE